MEVIYERGIGVFVNIRRTSLLVGYRLISAGPLAFPWPSLVIGRKVN